MWVTVTYTETFQGGDYGISYMPTRSAPAPRRTPPRAVWAGPVRPLFSVFSPFLFFFSVFRFMFYVFLFCFLFCSLVLFLYLISKILKFKNVQV
jgi:hypothetical protein